VEDSWAWKECSKGVYSDKEAYGVLVEDLNSI